MVGVGPGDPVLGQQLVHRRHPPIVTVGRLRGVGQTLRMADSDLVDVAGRPRWRGQPGRLEVHYLTATDHETGAGVWLHHEVVAPPTGDAYAHGWLTTFPADGPPTCTRF